MRPIPAASAYTDRAASSVRNAPLKFGGDDGCVLTTAGAKRAVSVSAGAPTR